MKLYTNCDICPYCKSKTIRTTAAKLPFAVYDKENGNVLLCPNCQALTYYDKKPGIVANKFLRLMRVKTHEYIDIIWKTKIVSREKMYSALADFLKADKKYCHVRYFGVSECAAAIAFTFEYISRKFAVAKDLSMLDASQQVILKYIVCADDKFVCNNKFNDDVMIKQMLNLLSDNLGDIRIREYRNGACSVIINHDKIKTIKLKTGSLINVFQSYFTELERVMSYI